MDPGLKVASPILSTGIQSQPGAAGPTVLCADFHSPHLPIDSLEVCMWKIFEALQ